MTADKDARFRCSGQVHARQFDEETIIVDLARGEYFALDEVGGEIWNGLANGLSRTEIVDRLVATYDADAQTIRSDVERIIGELLGAGLLVEMTQEP